MKRDLLSVIERLLFLMDENRVEMLARQHGVRQKRDDGSVKKTFAAYVRRPDEGTLSRLVVEASILLAASRGNSTAILKEAAATYTVGTDAITAKVRQEFSAKRRPRRRHNQPSRTLRKQPKVGLPSGFSSLSWLIPRRFAGLGEGHRPIDERLHRRTERFPKLGDFIFYLWWKLRMNGSLHQLALLKETQLLRQHTL